MRDRGVEAHSAECLNSVLNVKALVGAFKQEKALVGAFSVISNLRIDLFEALLVAGGAGPNNANDQLYQLGISL